MTTGRSRPPVFDLIDRTDARPSDHAETSFRFLNRVAGDYWAQVRQLVQEWLDRVADDENYRDLRGRLRKDNAANYSAFLELYIHELFRVAGYRVTIHPSVPGSSRRPDFLIEGYGDSFYVEATMPGPRQGPRQGQLHRRNDFLDTINRCTNPDFVLSLDDLVVGPTPAQGKLARSEIEQWLGTLGPNEVSYHPGSQAIFRWAKDGWEAEFSAIRVSPNKLDHRAIWVYADGEAGISDDAPMIRSALATKANAYGDLDRPLIIALGTYIWDRDRWHFTNALYGREAVTSWVNAATSGTTLTRKSDGYFGTPDKWTNRGVSGVLHVNQLQPYHVHRAEVTLWPHPEVGDAMYDVSGRIPATAIRWSAGVLQETTAQIDPVGHFGIPDQWPAGKAFPTE